MGGCPGRILLTTAGNFLEAMGDGAGDNLIGQFGIAPNVSTIRFCTSWGPVLTNRSLWRTIALETLGRGTHVTLHLEDVDDHFKEARRYGLFIRFLLCENEFWRLMTTWRPRTTSRMMKEEKSTK